MINLKTFESFLYEKKTKKTKDYLLFNGNKLDFIEDDKVTKSWKAVSGRTYYHWYISPSIWKKRYNMSPDEWSKAKDEGPTPPGKYTLGITQKRTSTGKWEKDAQFVKSVVAKQTIVDLPKSPITKDEPHEFQDKTPTSEVAWGDYRWALKPKSGTKTHGRSSFYLHGGSTPGSIGCIDLVTDSGDFAKYYEKWRSKTKKSTIELVVDYSTYKKDTNIDVESQPYKMNPETAKDNKTWYTHTNKEITDTLGKEKIKINPDVLKKRT